MIELCDGRYALQRDDYGWVLMERWLKEDGTLCTHRRKTYHPNLSGALFELLDRQCGACEGLEQLITLLREAQDGLIAAVVSTHSERSGL